MAQIQKPAPGYVTGDQVTAANLNALVDQATLVAGAITDQTAKAQPLAADSILLHSAADNALRKSTLTQLFTNATLVTPALGTPSALVGTNITGTAAGLTAGNVTTNANLTGAITSTGNATSLGSFSSANLASALTDETGTGANVFATSPTLVTPILGTPQSGTLTSCTGLPISTGVSGLGTGVATALAVNVGSAGAPVVNGGALGTPSSGTVTNLTGTASININGTVGATTASTGVFTNVRIGSATSDELLTINGSSAGFVSRITNSAASNPNGFYYNSTNAIGTGTAFRVDSQGVSLLTLNSTGLAVTGALSATTAAGGFTMSQSTSGELTIVNGRNTNAGNDASVRILLGNDSSASAAQIQMYGSNDATFPNVFRVGTSISGTTMIGTINNATITTTSSTGLAVTGALSATGVISTANLGLLGNQINETLTNANASIAINYAGYNLGTTQFRDLNIFDGKNALAASFAGSTKSFSVVGNVGFNGKTPAAPPAGTGMTLAQVITALINVGILS